MFSNFNVNKNGNLIFMFVALAAIATCNSSGNKTPDTSENIAEENNKEWISLFYGTTTSGWQ